MVLLKILRTYSMEKDLEKEGTEVPGFLII